MRWLHRVKEAVARRRFFAVVSIFATILCSGAGFLALPYAARTILVSTLSKSLDRAASVERIRINPLTLSATLLGFKISERDGAETFVSADRVHMDIGIRSLVKGRLIVEELSIERPFVRIVRHERQLYNFSDILNRVTRSGEDRTQEEQGGGEQGKAEREGAKGGAPKLSLRNISLTDGEVLMDDIPRGRRHALSGITIAIPFISNTRYGSQKSVEPVLSAFVNNTFIESTGSAKPFSDTRETSLELKVQNLDLSEYLPYIPAKLKFDVVSGTLDADLCITFRQGESEGNFLGFKGDVTLRDLHIADKLGGPLVEIGDVHAVRVGYDVFTGKLMVGKVVCKSPKVHLVRGRDGEINLASAFFPEASREERAGGSHRGISVAISELEVDDGRLVFADRTSQKPFRTVLEPVSITMRDFSTGRGSRAPFTLQLASDAGESAKAEGTLALSPFELACTADLKNVSAPVYFPYYGSLVNFDVPQGRIDIQGRFELVRQEGKGTRMSIEADRTVINALKLTKRGGDEDIITCPRFIASKGSLDTQNRTISIEGISTSKGFLALARTPSGVLDLPGFFRPAGRTGAENGGRSWRVEIGTVEADEYTVRFRDETLSSPTTHHAGHLRLSLGEFSTVAGNRSSLSLAFELNDKGSVSLQGEVGFSPFQASLDVDCNAVDIGFLRDYSPERIHASIVGGTLSAKGSLLLLSSEPAGLVATYRGGASISELNTIRNKDGRPLLLCNRIDMDAMSAGIDPLHFNAKRVTLTGIYSGLTVLPDGKLDLWEILETGTPEKTPTRQSRVVASNTAHSPPGAPYSPASTGPASGRKRSGDRTIKQLRIDQLVISGGSMHFVDRRVTPFYWTSMDDIEGTISGFVSEGIKPATVNLKGKQNKYSPLHIEGRVLPFRENLLIDVAVRFKDVDMVQINPYSRKVLGHTIQKGKANLDLKCLIDRNKLDSRNRIIIDNMSLGNALESSEGPGFPIKTAIAVLKNRNGEIQLDIPISGNLDDPEFSLHGIVVKFFTRLIEKALTAPFTFLGLPFGRGEELRYLEFDPGSSKVSDETREKLEILAQAVREKPKLDIELEGHVDLELDREAMHRKLFYLKLQEQKFKEMIRKGMPSVHVEEITLDAKEYDRYLEMAYKAETFPKPKNFLGLEKKISPPEMEALMMQHVAVEDEDLRLLALRRAIVVRDYLVSSGNVDAQRIFLVEPESLAPRKERDLRHSRVDVRIK